MIYIIDYGLNNLFELFKNDYGTLKCKIGEIEFELGNDPITLTSISDKIFKKVELLKRIGHYEFDGKILSNEDRSTQWRELRKNGFYDGEDNDIWVFDTREDKLKFEEFERNWKPVFLEPEVRWDEVEFQVIRKQFIEEKHRPFIESQIVIETRPDKVEAICTYSPNFDMMFRKQAIELGFAEIEHKTFDASTKGKKFSFHSGIKYSKCNDEYVSKFFENKGLFNSKKGTYDDCVTSFERDYNAIATYLNLQVQTIEKIEIEPLMIRTVYDAILNIKSTANKIDSMKATRSDLNSLLKQISALETKLLER